MAATRIGSIDTRPDGTTTIVGEDNSRLELTPEASALLADHLLMALKTTITLMPHGRHVTKVEPPERG